MHTHLFWQPPSHHTPRLLLEREALQVVILVMLVMLVVIVVIMVLIMVLIRLDALNMVLKSLKFHLDFCVRSHSS